MQLSVIIVNYNVRYFLEQALRSVERAGAGIEMEVFVVDNNSADDSVEMVRRDFPWVRLIARTDNPGFSIANNQAIRLSKGKHVLLLNPDTVVREDTFSACLNFMEAHPRCGGLGVRMIDGAGRFLPESKRGLPTPWVAFTKAFGLARIFPKSQRFNHYHLGYLPEMATNQVEVLAGAFMWMRREALEEVGLLDEQFFMYGEDIDLSYRLIKGGWENWYYPETSIIHYKGESTKRGSLNYVRTFYQAMIIFARKHFVGRNQTFLVAGMRLAIYLRASLSLIFGFWRKWRLPITDATGIYLGLVALKTIWAQYHFQDADYYDDRILYLHFPAYCLMWLLGIFLAGGYDRPQETGRLVRGLGVSTLLLLAIYGLLPGELRPSRALLILGAAWATAWTLSLRLLHSFLRSGNFRLGEDEEQRLLIVGSEQEAERTLQLLRTAGARRNYLGRVDPGPAAARLPELIQLYRAEELIFCSADIPNTQIQAWMSDLGPQLQYRILPEASSSIIGSHRSDRRGTLYTIDISLRIDQPMQRRAKWLFDKGLALLLLISWPLTIWMVQDRLGYLGNIMRVLRGQRSWVAYAPADPQRQLLPELKEGILHPATGHSSDIDVNTLHRLNLLYARDYAIGDDWGLVIRNFKRLGD